MRWTRRQFLAGSGAAAGALALGTGACSSDPGSGSGPDPGDGLVDGVIDAAAIPSAATIYGWIEEIVERGIRRPGYAADVWVEDHLVEFFEGLGLEAVRKEPVEVTRWEPTNVVLEVTPDGEPTRHLDACAMPHSQPTVGLELALRAWDSTQPATVAGHAALFTAAMVAIPGDTAAGWGSLPTDRSRRVVDPEGTLKDPHMLPFLPSVAADIDAVIDAGAAAVVGTLKGYPGNPYRFYLPYDARARTTPAVWISGRDGDWFAAKLAAGGVTIRLTVETTNEPHTSYNIVGELPGADDETVIVGSHHDGPWASAVEDASGIALVKAQASYWAAQPRRRRPHRLVFLLQAAHMHGSAGGAAYIDAHRDELDHVVLEVHLEHAALDVEEKADGEVVATDRNVPRWFFTSRIAPLEAAVYDALDAERLHRSMLLAPDTFGEGPTTDGGFFYGEGVPITQFLAAPVYLVDASDTLDKIDRAALEPLTRATVRILASTAGTTAAAMRAAVEP